ncbi:hypothetical protein DIPPA_25069 [Diplonema papillatum]|nr:hypothetical protein DIPPA_25069 [Diplonema papillatum]
MVSVDYQFAQARTVEERRTAQKKALDCGKTVVVVRACWSHEEAVFEPRMADATHGFFTRVRRAFPDAGAVSFAHKSKTILTHQPPTVKEFHDKFKDVSDGIVYLTVSKEHTFG